MAWRGDRSLAHHGETALFWTIALAHLVPIWAFRYMPTQDGPVHLSSAAIVLDVATGGPAAEFFQVRLDPIPNWNAQLLLAGLLLVVSPLLAEKLLLSGYVLGSAAAFRYWGGTFGDRTRPLALLGLLFVYNRCLWMGFYNFVLSLPLCWLVLAYWLRRRERSDLLTASSLALLLLVVFFTHLIGFVIAVIGLVWFAVTSPRRRWVNLGWVTLACLPASLLLLDYFDQTRFVGSGGANHLWGHARQWLSGRQSWDRLDRELAAIEVELFANHIQDAVPMGLMVFALFVLLGAVAIFDVASGAVQEAGPARWPVVLLALSFAVLYVVLPEHLGGHGGFLKARLALVPPLLLLACLREPAPALGRWLVRAACVAIVAVNLFLIVQRVGVDNVELDEYTAGATDVGSGHVLFVVQDEYGSGRPRRRQLVDPLLHASHYYCHGKNSVNLDNFQATTTHFALSFRAGVRRGRASFIPPNPPAKVDAIVVWDAAAPRVPAGFEVLLRRERLLVLVKAPK